MVEQVGQMPRIIPRTRDCRVMSAMSLIDLLNKLQVCACARERERKLGWSVAFVIFFICTRIGDQSRILLGQLSACLSANFTLAYIVCTFCNFILSKHFIWAQRFSNDIFNFHHLMTLTLWLWIHCLHTVLGTSDFCHYFLSSLYIYIFQCNGDVLVGRILYRNNTTQCSNT